MSPAAELLESIRLRRKLSQSVFSRLVGLHPSYFSGIVRGKYHVPRHPRFVEQVSSGLGLSDLQTERLTQAIEMSPTALAIPPNADREVFLLLAELRNLLDGMDGCTAREIHRQISTTCLPADA